jgi:hypothetical protein
MFTESSTGPILGWFAVGTAGGLDQPDGFFLELGE